MLVFALLVGVHRRAHGRPNAGVPRQEDPGARDEARGALHPRRAARRSSCSPASSVLLDTVEDVRSSIRARTVSPRSSYAFTSAANNNGSAFGGLTGNTDWYNTTLGLAMLVGPLPADDPGARDRGLAGRKQTGAGVGRHVPDRHAAVRRAARPASCVIVVGLTYFPVVALGPIVEHLVESNVEHRASYRVVAEGPTRPSQRVRCSTPRSCAARRRLRSRSSTRGRWSRNPVMFVVEIGSVLTRSCSSATSSSATARRERVRRAGRGVAVVHGAVRQLRRSGGRRPRQGAGRHAAQGAHRHHGAPSRRPTARSNGCASSQLAARRRRASCRPAS